MARVRIGELLVRRGDIDLVQLQSALAHQRRWGGRLGRAIVHLGFMEERPLLETVSEQLGVPFLEIGDRRIPYQVVALLPEKLIRTRKVLPIELLGTGKRGPLLVALQDPADLRVIDEISFATGMTVKPVLVAEPDVERAIARHLGGTVPAEGGFAAREDAIDLPEDTNPLSVERDPTGGPGRKLLH